MAMLDYGAVGFKNGKLISTGFFTPMEETCGYSDKGNPLAGKDWSFDGNYFLTIGNEELLIGFYKNIIRMWGKDSGDEDNRESVCFGAESFYNWKYWHDYICTPNYYATITVKPKCNHIGYLYYVANIEIRNSFNSYKNDTKDSYKVYFGYGVDLGFYEKTGRVNYYNSSRFHIQDLKFRWKCRFGWRLHFGRKKK